ncbi:MAG: amidohydrolase [Saprospiraceae bacterium]|nr:amidohydrolase [Saprospiraceae bacterium]
MKKMNFRNSIVLFTLIGCCLLATGKGLIFAQFNNASNFKQMLTKEQVKTAAENMYKNYTLAAFSDLEQLAEPSRGEVKTSQYVQNECKKKGIDYRVSEIDHLTVFAKIVGTKPSLKTPITIGYKCDLDALKRGDKGGFYHGCFHSGHMAIALSVMKFLNDNKDQFSSTIYFMYQSSEEVVGPSGAEQIIEKGEIQKLNIQKLIALHASPEIEVAHVAFREGIAQASVDELMIAARSSKAAHVQYQHIPNPIFALSETIQSLQKLSAQGNPMQPILLNWTKLWTNIDPNSVNSNKVPTEAYAVASFRVFDESQRDSLKLRIEKICKGIEMTYNDSLSIVSKFNLNDEKEYKGVKSVLNDTLLTRELKGIAIDYLGKRFVMDAPQRMGGDDIGWYSHIIPTCIYRLGVGNKAKGWSAGLHSNDFHADPESLKVGTGLMIWMILQMK